MGGETVDGDMVHLGDCDKCGLVCSEDQFSFHYGHQCPNCSSLLEKTWKTKATPTARERVLISTMSAEEYLGITDFR